MAMSIKQLNSAIASWGKRSVKVVKKLTALLRRTDQAVALLTEGQGTAGLLLKDNRLYEEMVLTVRRMTKALDDFRDVMELAKKGELKIKAF